jgi:hypothetical protein
MVDLTPGENIEYVTGEQDCSHPYPLDWIGEGDGDYKTELELMKEIGDTLHI